MNAPTQLQILRHCAGLTQYELGRLVGRDQNWISGAERGLRKVTPADIDKLAAALGVSTALLRPLDPPVVATPKERRRVRA